MALSDEDRAAIAHVRMLVAGMPSQDKEHLERVLRLADEGPAEPDEGTFWLDPEENDLWIRDDRAVTFGFDLARWFRTGDDQKFTWAQAPRLTELVRADEASKRYRTFLMELHGSWEAWHHNACGMRGLLSGCEYHECVHRWGVLLGYGFEKEWEEI
jgi:hypothetical protein